MLCLNLFLLLFLGDSLCQSEEYPCDESQTIDISDGELFSNGSIVINGTTVYEKHNYYRDEEQNVTLGCICHVKTCISKCCLPNEQYIIDINGIMTCVDKSTQTQFELYEGTQKKGFSNHNFHFLTFYGCKPSQEGFNTQEPFYLQQNGSLYLPTIKPMREVSDYCLDKLEDVTKAKINSVLHVVLCTLPENDVGNKHEKFKYIGKLNVT